MEGMDLREGTTKIGERLSELNGSEVAILLGFKKLIRPDDPEADASERLEETDWAFSIGAAYYYEKRVSSVVLRNVSKTLGL